MKLNIMGDGSITSGDFEKVSVVGNAKAVDEFTTNKLKVVGELFSETNIKAINTSIVGDIICKDLNTDYLKLVGNITCDNITSERTTFIGIVEVDTIKGNEIITRSALLNVKEINGDILNLRNVSGEVGSLHGEKIKVYKKRGLSFVSSTRKPLNVNEIEGDYIYLENVIAKDVKGEIVKIGPNCKIENVYSKNLDIHKSSKVMKVL